MLDTTLLESSTLQNESNDEEGKKLIILNNKVSLLRSKCFGIILRAQKLY